MTVSFQTTHLFQRETKVKDEKQSLLDALEAPPLQAGPALGTGTEEKRKEIVASWGSFELWIGVKWNSPARKWDVIPRFARVWRVWLACAMMAAGVLFGWGISGQVSICFHIVDFKQFSFCLSPFIAALVINIFSFLKLLLGDQNELWSRFAKLSLLVLTAWHRA